MLHKISLISLIYLVGSIFLASGCMKLKKKSEEEKGVQAEVALESQSTEVQQFDFEYEFDEGTQKVRFKIPKTWPETVVIEKTVGSEKATMREIVITNQVWKDILSENSKTTYRFFEVTEKDLKLIEQLDVIPSLNFNLVTEINLEKMFGSLSQVKKIRFQNLEMNNESKLFIGNFKGTLQIDHILSEKGTIQTFVEGARAAQGDGRSVGDINVKILDGTGELNFYFVAEAGANGANGNEPDAALKGADGTDGAPATFALTRTGNCAEIGITCMVPAQIFDCIKAPVEGGDAKEGLRGYPGKPGKNGGSVRRVTLENLSSALVINTYKRAGKKGLGGFGGNGGEPGTPGRGGDGGQKDFYRFFNVNPSDPRSMAKLIGSVMGNTCPAASAGRTAGRGPQGNPGPDGEDGIIF